MCRSVHMLAFQQALQTVGPLGQMQPSDCSGCTQVWVEEFKPCHQECFSLIPPHAKDDDTHSQKFNPCGFFKARICHNHPSHGVQNWTLIKGHTLVFGSGEVSFDPRAGMSKWPKQHQTQRLLCMQWSHAFDEKKGEKVAEDVILASMRSHTNLHKCIRPCMVVHSSLCQYSECRH